ncbi:hypothetical protein LINGRAHAP2_LOCUS14243 [Linum grandiflorum]
MTFLFVSEARIPAIILQAKLQDVCVSMDSESSQMTGSKEQSP